MNYVNRRLKFRDRMVRRVLSCICLTALAIGGEANGQVATSSQYPNKPLRILSSGPGGTIDFGARQLAQGLSDAYNQSVIVENRPAGVITGQTVARAQPDGYTLLFTGGSLWVEPLIQSNVPYDPFKDFSPISLFYNVPYALVVHPSVPAKSVKELIALAKAKPGTMNYSTSSAGSASTLAGALFAYMADINIVPIRYKAAGARTIAVLAGEVQMDFASPGEVSSHVKAGKLRVLGVTTEKMSALLPGVPPIVDMLPGYVMSSTAAVFAPARTPTDIVNRLSLDVIKVVNRPDIRSKLITAGADPIGSSPEQLSNYMRAEVARMSQLTNAIGLRAE